MSTTSGSKRSHQRGIAPLLRRNKEMVYLTVLLLTMVGFEFVTPEQRFAELQAADARLAVADTNLLLAIDALEARHAHRIDSLRVDQDSIQSTTNAIARLFCVVASRAERDGVPLQFRIDDTESAGLRCGDRLGRRLSHRSGVSYFTMEPRVLP